MFYIFFEQAKKFKDHRKLCVSVVVIILSALLSVYLKMNVVFMAWMLHHSRVKNLVRASITRMKNLYHKNLRMVRERTLLFGFHLDMSINLRIITAEKKSGKSINLRIITAEKKSGKSINLRIITAEKKSGNNLVLQPKRHLIIYYDSKFVWRGHEYSWFDPLSQYSNKTLHCTSF